ncbi:MAG: hypothetical protein RBS51_00165 [Anaerovoracaceae bacterium]|nr:hypothetical protein [Anaerovoracaceae bacterium]
MKPNSKIRNFKRLVSIFLMAAMILTTLPVLSVSAIPRPPQSGSYNVVGLENFDYDLEVELVKRNSAFKLNHEKLSFYMLGCDLISSSSSRAEFEIRNDDYGAKFVFIAPEAGRKSGKLETRDFYSDANSILRVKNVD